MARGTFEYRYPRPNPHKIAGSKGWSPLDALADMLTRTPATLRKSNPIHLLLSTVALLIAILTVARRVMPHPYLGAVHTYI